MAALWDFTPTALELAGVPPVPGLDGISYAPVLAGRDGAQRKHDALYWESYEPPGPKVGDPERQVESHSIRCQEQTPPGPFELYDLEEDPGRRPGMLLTHTRMSSRSSKRQRPPRALADGVFLDEKLSPVLSAACLRILPTAPQRRSRTSPPL